VASGLAPRWAAKQPQSRSTRCIRYNSAAGLGAAAQPNAGQARSPHIKPAFHIKPICHIKPAFHIKPDFHIQQA